MGKGYIAIVFIVLSRSSHEARNRNAEAVYVMDRPFEEDAFVDNMDVLLARTLRPRKSE